MREGKILKNGIWHLAHKPGKIEGSRARFKCSACLRIAKNSHSLVDFMGSACFGRPMFAAQATHATLVAKFEAANERAELWVLGARADALRLCPLGGTARLAVPDWSLSGRTSLVFSAPHHLGEVNRNRYDKC